MVLLIDQWSFGLQVSLPGSWVPKRKQFCIQGGPKVLQFIHLPSIKIVIPLVGWRMTYLELETNALACL